MAQGFTRYLKKMADCRQQQRLVQTKQVADKESTWSAVFNRQIWTQTRCSWTSVFGI